MSNETKKSALDQLRELQQNDNISTLDFKEPELKTFDYNDVLEYEEKPEKKSFIFGKRANRHATVKIKETELEEKPEVEDIMKTNGFGMDSILDEEVSLLKEEKPLSRASKLFEEIKEESIDEEKALIKDSKAVEEVKEEPIVEEEISLKKEDNPFLRTSKRLEEMKEEPVIEENASTQDLEFSEEFVDQEPVVPSLEEDEEQFEEKFDEEDEEINDSDETESVLIEEDEEELFVEKKKFLLSQYQKEEIYLEQKSREGFHFVRHVGKKFYFVQGDPAHYYYSINYFSEEPDADQWREWEKDGWKLVSRSPAKKKKEAGWFIFRNEESKGEYRKEIENEEEKYHFYRKYSNSCRSTMFLIFMCMAMCAVAAFLQWEFKGYLWGFVLCGVVFVASFIVFCMYGRMLHNSKKAARQLQTKIRTKERRAAFYAQHTLDTSESEEELDTDWNTLESEVAKTQKLRRSRR